MAFMMERFPEITARVADPRLRRTQAEFRELYQEGLERGSQLTVYVDGKVALDMYGGRNAASVFRQDQIVTLFSSGKVIEGIVVAMLVDQGLVKYESRVSEFITGFYDAELTVKQLMQHCAGAAACTKLAPSWDALQAVMADSLETIGFINRNLSQDNLQGGKIAPVRDTRYHACTRGMFISVMVLRLTGMTMDVFVQERIVKPVQAAEASRGHAMTVQLHIGRLVRVTT